MEEGLELSLCVVRPRFADTRTTVKSDVAIVPGYSSFTVDNSCRDMGESDQV